MMDKKANKAIKCTVETCAYKCPSESYCSLEAVQIGAHEANPTTDACVDCKSFSLK